MITKSLSCLSPNTEHSCLIALDTEFTSFKCPQLWSIGLYASEDCWFYGQIDIKRAHGEYLLKESSEFVKTEVLGQFELIKGSSFESPALLGKALGRWFLDDFKLLKKKPACVIFDSNHDLDLLKNLWKASGFDFGDYIVYKNVVDLTANFKSDQAMEKMKTESFLIEKFKLKPHHALLDAHCLKEGYLANFEKN